MQPRPGRATASPSALGDPHRLLERLGGVARSRRAAAWEREGGNTFVPAHFCLLAAPATLHGKAPGVIYCAMLCHVVSDRNTCICAPGLCRQRWGPTWISCAAAVPTRSPIATLNNSWASP